MMRQGRAFDKVARLLDLGYPGGPAVQRAAEEGDVTVVDLPRPMLRSDDFDFSFSGLKTAVMNIVRSEGGNVLAADLAASFQEAVADVLVAKTVRAAEEKGVSSIIIAGGVAANQRLRELLVNSAGNVMVHIPPLSLCTDNAAMIASCAYFNNNPVSWRDITANPNLRL